MPSTDQLQSETYELFVVFVGMVGWVPRTERLVGGGEVETCATALLPRVVKGDEELGYTTAGGMELGTHHPYLKLLVGSCEADDAGDLPKAYEIEDKRVAKLVNLAEVEPKRWDLDREAIEIEPSGTGRATQPHLRGLRGFSAPFPEDRSDLTDHAWLASMEEIARWTSCDPSGVATVDPTCLVCSSQTHRRVAAQVEVRHGCLATMGLAEVRKRTPAYGYKSLHPKSRLRSQQSRAVSEYVIQRVTIHDPERLGVTLTRRPFQDGTPARAVTLRPQRFFGKDKILLVVENLPAHEHEHHDRSHPVHHFEVFYELSAQPPDEMHRPVPYVANGSSRRSYGFVVPGTDLETLRKKKLLFTLSREKRKKILVTKALFKVMTKGSGRPLCPEAEFNPVELV